jgi:hypothetical protein
MADTVETTKPEPRGQMHPACGELLNLLKNQQSATSFGLFRAKI